jgi:Phage integrase family
VGRRLSTLASFYRYCEQEQCIDRNPALNVWHPKVDHESRTLGLDRNELGAFLVQAALGSLRDHALASLLALNGLRISEALGADIEDLDFDRGHRTLRIVRKGDKHAVVPLAPRTSRAIDLYLGERQCGPIFLAATGGRMERCAAVRTVKRLRPAGRDHQADLAPQSAPHVHHRRPRRRRDPPGRARGGQPRRPPHDHALRPGPPHVGPARHLMGEPAVVGRAAGRSPLRHHRSGRVEGGGCWPSRWQVPTLSGGMSRTEVDYADGFRKTGPAPPTDRRRGENEQPGGCLGPGQSERLVRGRGAPGTLAVPWGKGGST